jgi:hypothetical protein
MKGLILIGAMIALFVAVLPLVSQKAYAADTGYIELLVPAESQEVKMGGGEIPFATLVFEKSTGVAGLCPAETQEVEMGGIPWPAKLEKEDAAGRIERLCPAE